MADIKYYGHKWLDKFLHQRYFNDLEKRICMEAGAYDGVAMSSCKIFEDNMGWKCINIEANPDLYEELVVNREKSINLNIALSDKEGLMTFQIPKRQKHGHLVGPNGVLPHLSAICKNRNNTIKGKVCEVRATTYKKLVEELNIEKLDLFVLDIEGWEPMAIKGMTGAEVLPDVMCVEVCASVNEITNYDDVIREVFDDLYVKHSKCWVNYIYVKRGSRYEKL